MEDGGNGVGRDGGEQMTIMKNLWDRHNQSISDMSRVDPGLLVSEGSKLSALDISGNNLSGVDPIKNAKGVISRMDSCQGLFDQDGNMNDEDRFDLTIEEVVWTGMLYCTVSSTVVMVLI